MSTQELLWPGLYQLVFIILGLHKLVPLKLDVYQLVFILIGLHKLVPLKLDVYQLVFIIKE